MSETFFSGMVVFMIGNAYQRAILIILFAFGCSDSSTNGGPNSVTTDVGAFDCLQLIRLAELVEWLAKARRHLGGDALGLDFPVTAEGEWILLESKDPPGVLGFRAQALTTIAGCLRERMHAQ